MKKGRENKNEKTFTNSLKGSRFWGLLLFLILVQIDQITKIISDVYFEFGKPVVLIPHVLEWGPMQYNRGFAFSSLAGGDTWLKLLLVLSTAVLMIILAIAYCKTDKNRTLFRLALVFIIAGGVANFIDRMYYGVWDPSTYKGGYRDGVRDMLHVVFIFDFGCCNIADFFIVAGVIMMVLALLFFDSHAVFPVGKYKRLAIAENEKLEEKKKEKQTQKNKQALKEMKETSEK